MSFGETRTLIAARDESVTIRCAAGDDDQPRWVKVTPAVPIATAVDDAAEGGGGDTRLVVSTRRRLALEADMQGRDGVYLCVLSGSSASPSSSSARLAANITILSPCKTHIPYQLTLVLYATRFFLVVA